MSRLIDDVLDLSKIRAGKIEWHLKKLHSASVIQKAIDAVHCLLLKKDLRIVAQIEEELPTFRADEDRIIQVLTNLVGNAIKFTPPGRAGCRKGGALWRHSVFFEAHSCRASWTSGRKHAAEGSVWNVACRLT
ncbi:MAG: sensor histidine kinase [bacterium]